MRICQVLLIVNYWIHNDRCWLEIIVTQYILWLWWHDTPRPERAASRLASPPCPPGPSHLPRLHHSRTSLFHFDTEIFLPTDFLCGEKMRGLPSDRRQQKSRVGLLRGHYGNRGVRATCVVRAHRANETTRNRPSFLRDRWNAGH